MAQLRMKRIEIIALMEDRKNIMERLQRRGIIEFSDCRDEALVKMNTVSNVSQFEKNISAAVQAKEILQEYAPPKKSFLSSLNGRREIEKDEFGRYVDQKYDYLEICFNLIHLKKVITENRAAVIRTQTLMEALRIWIGLDIPMQCKGTKSTRCFIGSIPRQWTKEDILIDIAKRNPSLEMIDVEIVSSYKEQTCIAVFCHHDAADDTSEVLRQMDFISPSDPTKHPPRHRMQRYEDALVQYGREISESIEKIKIYADKDSEIEFLIDYLVMRKDKYLALSKIGLTAATFIISGYIPENYAKKCITELEARYTVAIALSTPDDTDDVPVVLENGEFVSPVEGITEMYSLPGKKDIDPSPVMAFFYYLFFGMMLSDAGYGVLMVLITAIALKSSAWRAP